MFYSNQNLVSQKEYKKFLQVVGSLSNLFSESNIPYLYYRIAEKIFCKAFNAEDLSRSDVSVDSKKEILGIGLKTFLAGNCKTFQKITEFGSTDRTLYESLSLQKKIFKIAEIRNERIAFTQRVHNIESSIYHCIVREDAQFNIFEETMHFIEIENIKNIKEKKGSIIFEDGKEEYSFLVSKNTLTKRFNTSHFLEQFEVKLIENPLEMLLSCKNEYPLLFSRRTQQTIFLPLYGREHIVYTNSGLNQWNAKGRKRDYDEVYIPIPAIIHRMYPNFFPNRNKSFNLKLPNSAIMGAKVCQDGGKALMSKSNKELGKWILRDILKLKEGELLTYEKLQILGIDSVRLDKVSDENYEINFAKNGSYDQFIESLEIKAFS